MSTEDLNKFLAAVVDEDNETAKEMFQKHLKVKIKNMVNESSEKLYRIFGILTPEDVNYFNDESKFKEELADTVKSFLVDQEDAIDATPSKVVLLADKKEFLKSQQAAVDLEENGFEGLFSAAIDRASPKTPYYHDINVKEVLMFTFDDKVEGKIQAIIMDYKAF